MVTRVIVVLWSIGATICGANVLYDAQHDPHGSVSFDLCTDCAQFKRWLGDD